MSRKIIEYHGYQADVRPFIKKCHCFILPSYHEGMANTLLEAAAMGRPLITSRIHGCMEAVEEGINGYLVNVKDSEKLLEQIKKFLNIDYDNKKMMGNSSRKIVERKFDKAKVVEKTIKVLGV